MVKGKVTVTLIHEHKIMMIHKGPTVNQEIPYLDVDNLPDEPPNYQEYCVHSAVSLVEPGTEICSEDSTSEWQDSELRDRSSLAPAEENR